MKNGILLKKTTLEKKGEHGYALYRIPSIAATSAGTVLCCCEARTSPGDWCSERLFLHRSTDGGVSFSPRQAVAFGDAGRAVHNPVLIADGARVHLLWNEDYRRAFHAVSTDGGLCFEKAREITGAFEAFRPRYDWNICALGPGHGCVLPSGRLAVPVWIGHGKPLDSAGRVIEHRPTVAGMIFSDDGIHWKPGGLVDKPLANPNETTAAILSDGRLLLNIRHESDTMYRALSWSVDGVSLSRPVYDMQLPDPMCFGSLTPIRGREFLFVNCANNNRYPFAERIHLTVRFSGDDCTTWTRAFELDGRGGYADICTLPDQKTACCFYERQDGEQFDLVCARLSLEALRADDQRLPPKL